MLQLPADVAMWKITSIYSSKHTHIKQRWLDECASQKQ